MEGDMAGTANGINEAAPEGSQGEHQPNGAAVERENALENAISFLKNNELVDDLSSSVLYQVHEDLRLVRKWTNLRVVKGLTRTYMAGSAAPAYDSVFPKAGEDVDRTQVVVPISTSEMLSPNSLQAICRECVHPETKEKLRCITAAIVDDDSTTAYYRIFDEWNEIVHPQWKQKKKIQVAEGATNDADEQDAGMKEGSGSDSVNSDSD